MRCPPALILGVVLALAITPAGAQDELTSVATLHLADGSSVALIDWKLTYDFAAWRQKEPITTAKTQTRQHAMLIVGKNTYPTKGETLTLTHVESGDTVRVTEFKLKKAGEIKMEGPAREVVAPDLEKSLNYQPRSLDISGKTLSGIERSFCLSSYSAQVECGGTKTTRVIQIDFN